MPPILAVFAGGPRDGARLAIPEPVPVLVFPVHRPPSYLVSDQPPRVFPVDVVHYRRRAVPRDTHSYTYDFQGPS